MALVNMCESVGMERYYVTRHSATPILRQWAMCSVYHVGVCSLWCISVVLCAGLQSMVQ